MEVLQSPWQRQALPSGVAENDVGESPWPPVVEWWFSAVSIVGEEEVTVLTMVVGQMLQNLPTLVSVGLQMEPLLEVRPRMHWGGECRHRPGGATLL